MTKDLSLEAVNSALSGQVQKLLAELKAADKRNAELMRIICLGKRVWQLQADSLSKLQLDIDVQSALKKAEDEYTDALKSLSQDGCDV
jgi:ribosomal 50S subunit-associated protein YjgA (DUF615 family)